MKKILVVIDMQNDFIDGALGSVQSQKILPNVIEKIKTFDGDIVFTKDTHSSVYPYTQEGKNLPVVHCIKGTAGWELEDEIKALSENKMIFEKPTFGSIRLAECIVRGDYREIELIGLYTDICVVTNALLLKSFLPECIIKVDSSCCAGTTDEKHRETLAVMESCHIKII